MSLARLLFDVSLVRCEHLDLLLDLSDARALLQGLGLRQLQRLFQLGQLLVIGVAWVAWRLLRDWPPFVRARTPVLYGIGSLAAFWTWSRVVAILA